MGGTSSKQESDTSIKENAPELHVAGTLPCAGCEKVQDEKDMLPYIGKKYCKTCIQAIKANNRRTASQLRQTSEKQGSFSSLESNPVVHAVKEVIQAEEGKESKEKENTEKEKETLIESEQNGDSKQSTQTEAADDVKSAEAKAEEETKGESEGKQDSQ